MNSKHAFLVLSTFTLVSIAYGEREVFAPTKLAPTATAGTIQFGDGTVAAPSITFSADNNTGFFRNGNDQIGYSLGGVTRGVMSGTDLYVGGGTGSSAPGNGAIRATSGSGTNIGGGNLEIIGGNSTGSGAGGVVRILTAPAGASGSTPNTLTERMRITSAGQMQVNGGATSLPSSSDSTVAVASGGYATIGNISNAIYGSTRGLLLLGGNYTAGTADVAGIKFLYGPRSTTSENTATIASVAANNTDTTANSGGSVIISTRPASGSLTERMRIDSAGLVGIGTTPSALLDVLNPSTAASSETARFRSDTAATPYISFFNGASRTGIIQFSASNLFLSADANKNVQITTSGTGALTQSTGGSERMRIDSSGNVGIGTNTNLSTLTINGPIAPKGPTDVNAATYTVQTTDSSLRFTTTNCTVTLPAAASFPGRILWLNTVTANSVTSNASNVIPLGSNTAGTAIFAATAGKFAMIQSNGTNWVTMMSN